MPFLTRREPDPSAPEAFEGGKRWEKFSLFVSLPAAGFAIQLSSCCVDESFFAAPFQFCDWDFCPSFGNYRNASAPLLNDATTCGRSAMAFGGGRNLTAEAARARDDDAGDDAALDGSPAAPFGGMDLALSSIVADARPSGIVLAKSLRDVYYAIGAFLGLLAVASGGRSAARRAGYARIPPPAAAAP